MDYEKQHKLNVLIYQQRVNRIYDEAIKIAAQMGITAKLDTEGDFQWSDFPQFTKRVEAMIENLEKQLEANIVSGIHQEWNLANKKNDELATKAVGEKDSLSAKLQKVYFGHNEEARDAFITRDQKGMNLSGRVWKLGEQFKKDTELGISAVLQDGLKNGKSAEEMGRKVKQYLNEPNRIFRRRRNKETGELELSKPAQNYHPGQGVYRSSRKNALRLTGTETNIAYHNADYERVKNFDFVLGVKVVVSKNHPVKDICDELAGVYPKGFRFTGWHPHCRCHTETILKTEQQRDEERRKRREALLNGEPIPEKTSEGEITTMPKNWSKWVDENKDKINSAEKRGKLPYFLQDNKWAITDNKAPAVTPVAEPVLTEAEIKEQARQKILEEARLRHKKRTKEQENKIADLWEQHNNGTLINNNSIPETDSQRFDYLLNSLTKYAPQVKDKINNSVAGMSIQKAYSYIKKVFYNGDKGCYIDAIEHLKDIENTKIDVDKLPNEWKVEYQKLIQKLNKTDFNGFYAVETNFLLIEKIDNIQKLSQNKTALKIGLDKISINTPANIFSELVEKEKLFSVNEIPSKEFFDSLHNFIPLKLKGESEKAYFNNVYNIVVLNLKDKKYKERLKNSSYHRKSILTHEYGHANDFNNPGGKLRENKDVIKLYKSFDKWFKDNEAVLESQMNDYYFKSNQNNKKDTLEELCAFSDVFQTYTGKKPYGGHDDSYFDDDTNKIAEFIAHASENAWCGNNFFKSVAPNLYKQMVDLIIKNKHTNQ